MDNRFIYLIIISTLFLFKCTDKYEGIDPVSLVDQAAELFKEDKQKKEAIKIWNYILKNEPDTSYAYGMSANNLHFNYTLNSNYKKSEKLFKKIIESKMSDVYMTNNIMEPFTNYRYNACIRMFQMYVNESKYREAIFYLNLAQTKYKYNTTSMSSYKKTIVENEIWNSRLHFDLGDTIKSKEILIMAGLNSDYYHHTKWSSFSTVRYERRIGEELIQLVTKREIADLIESIENGISNLKIERKNADKLQIIVIDSTEYEIPLYRNIEVDSCRNLLLNSMFMYQLKEEIKEKDDNN